MYLDHPHYLILGVRDFILKKSFSSLLGIQFGINCIFQENFFQNDYECYDPLYLLFNSSPCFLGITFFSMPTLKIINKKIFIAYKGNFRHLKYNGIGTT
jgi:hypothetical protein